MKQERDEFLTQFPVSHETLAKLDRYAELLIEWNEKFNLVAPSTLNHIWSRHFLDSAQLLRHIPDQSKRLIDIGSGAGFPGIILSIMGMTSIELVESIGKKAKFLQTVTNDLGLKIKLHHERVENLVNIKADIITARAVAKVNDLISLSKPIAKANTIYLFLKGKAVDSELTESAKSWTFTFDRRPSISDDSGTVLIIKDIKAKHAKAGQPHK